MSQKRPDTKRQRSIFSLCCQRHFIPSCAWHFFNMRYVNRLSPSTNGSYMSSTGADGTIHFWDKDGRIRLKCSLYSSSFLYFTKLSFTFPHPAFEAQPGPISATTFNRNGSIFAYAVSYDWHKGHSGMTPNHPNKLMLHACKDDEVKKRAKR